MTIVAVPEGAVRPLIRERDTEIREKAISHVKNVLKRETPTGGKYKEALTAKDIKQIVEQVKKEKL